MTEVMERTEETAVPQKRTNEVVRAVESTIISGDAQRAMFLPANMGEAMEMATLMAASNFVPKHLRQRPGDCLAVIMQSARWGMDPYAVGNKTYFVNDRMAFEAQLVAAVVNASNVLDGRLNYEWTGDGENLKCKVFGKVKGDPELKEREVSLSKITTRNSPLWKQDPEQQLGYFAGRAWARLHTPEVLMGVYTPDEIKEISAPIEQAPRMTREALANHADPEGGRADEEHGDQFDGTDSSQSPDPSDPPPIADADAVTEPEAGEEQQEGATPAATSKFTPPTLFEQLSDRLDMAADEKAVDDVQAEFDAREEEIPLADRPALQEKINAAEKRIANGE